MLSPRHAAVLSLTLFFVNSAAAQTVVNSTFQANGAAYYGDAKNWSPPEVPNNSPERSYNVTIPGFVEMDVDATISNLALTGRYSAEDHSLTIIGSTTVQDFSIDIGSSLPAGATFATGSLSSFSRGSLTGRYSVSSLARPRVGPPCNSTAPTSQP